MDHRPSLRLDVRYPTPWRKAPLLLFGNRQHRWRERALAGGTAALGIAATLLLVVGLSHDGYLTGDPTVAAAGPPPRAQDFPLIEEPPAPAATPDIPAFALRPPTPPAAALPPPQPPVPGPESAPPVAATPDLPPPSLATPLAAPPLAAAPPALPAPAPVVVPPPVEPPPVTPAATEPPARLVHYLQLGTYRQLESATEEQRRLAARGIETILHHRGDYYVLRLPPFASRPAAEAEERRLQGLGIDCVYVGPPR